MCLVVKHTHTKKKHKQHKIHTHTHIHTHTQRKYTHKQAHIHKQYTHSHNQTKHRQANAHTHTLTTHPHTQPYKSTTHLADTKHRALWRVREVGGASLDKQQHFLLPLASEGGEVGKEVLPRYLAIVTAHPVHLGHAGHGSLHNNCHYINIIPCRHWLLPTPTFCGHGSYHSGVGVTSSVDTITATALPCR